MLIRPLGALARGLAAGAVGSAAQNLFFKATAKLAPKSPEGVFQPPESAQLDESPTETILRRFVQGMLQREMPDWLNKRASTIVHFGFGAGWGAVYGLTRESFPAMASIPGALGFGVGVWAVSENLMEPAFRLAAPAYKYPLKTHAYAIAAHLAYGAAVAAFYEATRPTALAAAGAAMWAGLLHLGARRKLPRQVRRPAYAAIDAAAALRARRPLLRSALGELRA